MISLSNTYSLEFIVYGQVWSGPKHSQCLLMILYVWVFIFRLLKQGFQIISFWRTKNNQTIRMVTYSELICLKCPEYKIYKIHDSSDLIKKN